MKHRHIIVKGLLGFALVAGLSTAAIAATTCERTIMMGPGAREFTIRDLGVNDSVMLTLVNPTNCPLVFETSEALGPQNRWTVPPNSRQSVTFQYTHPYTSDVVFTIRQPDGTTLAQGILIPATEMQPASYVPVRVTPPQPVRGYW